MGLRNNLMQAGAPGQASHLLLPFGCAIARNCCTAAWFLYRSCFRFIAWTQRMLRRSELKGSLADTKLRELKRLAMAVPQPEPYGSP